MALPQRLDAGQLDQLAGEEPTPEQLAAQVAELAALVQSVCQLGAAQASQVAELRAQLAKVDNVARWAVARYRAQLVAMGCPIPQGY